VVADSADSVLVEASPRAGLASPGRRVVARIAELPVGLVVIGIMWAVGASIAQTTEHGDAIVYPAMGAGMLALLLYEVVCIAVWGQTLGKRLLHIRVVRVGETTAPGLGWSSLRFLLLYGVGCWVTTVGSVALVFVDRKTHRGLHDLAAQTEVIEVAR
jgi:uncharacterized RDD family membrane protein YckC